MHIEGRGWAEVMIAATLMRLAARGGSRDPSPRYGSVQRIQENLALSFVAGGLQSSRGLQPADDETDPEGLQKMETMVLEVLREIGGGGFQLRRHRHRRANDDALAQMRNRL